MNDSNKSTDPLHMILMPLAPEFISRVEVLRESYRVVSLVLDTAPHNRETALAKTNLEQSLMWAVKGYCLAKTEEKEEAPAQKITPSWHENVEIYPGLDNEYWVRWTGADFLYYWLHPTENRWVSEPEQISMGMFKNAAEAHKALENAPVPPALFDVPSP